MLLFDVVVCVLFKARSDLAGPLQLPLQAVDLLGLLLHRARQLIIRASAHEASEEHGVSPVLNAIGIGLLFGPVQEFGGAGDDVSDCERAGSFLIAQPATS